MRSPKTTTITTAPAAVPPRATRNFLNIRAR